MATRLSGTTLTTIPNPSYLGSPVTITAGFEPGTTGKVAFYDGATMLGEVNIVDGRASLTTPLLPAGLRSLEAYHFASSGLTRNTAEASHTVIGGPSLGLLAPVGYYAGPFVGLSSMAIGDFDSDGILDVVVSDGGVGQVSVLLGNGDGTFRTPTIYQGCSRGQCSVTAIAVGDFNVDGKPDLVTCGSFVFSGGGVSVLLGNGDGTFQPAVSFDVKAYPGSLVVADLNGDGKLDLAGANGDGITVLLGKGDGTFEDALTHGLGPTSQGGFPGSGALAVGDFNRDGRVDLAVLNQNIGTLDIFLGNGDGTFRTAAQIPVNTTAATQSKSIAVGDFNRDGIADLAVAGNVNVTAGLNGFGQYNGAITLLLGKGDGTFDTPISFLVNGASDGVAIGDMNGDGKLDVAAALEGGAIAVLLGNGDGTFRAPAYYPIGGSSQAVLIADFNRDTRSDIVSLNTNNSRIDVLLGTRSSGLSISQAELGNFAAGEVGAQYILTVANTGEEVWGTVTARDNLPQGVVATAIQGVGWSCNLNGVVCERSDELAAGNSYPPITISVNLANNLSGTVTNVASVLTDGGASIASSSASNTQFIRAGAAMALASKPNPSVLGQEVTLTATVSPDVDGIVTFSNEGTVIGSAKLVGGHAKVTTSSLPSGNLVLRAHYAGDSKNGPSDSTVSQTVAVNPTNGFQPAPAYTLGSSKLPQYIAAGDFNQDGKPDLVTANLKTNDVSVLLGKGDGTFRPAVRYSAGTAPAQAEVGDFNNDGRLDVVVLAAAGVTVLRGNGDGTFQTPLPFQSCGLVDPLIVISDFNRDGNLDVLCYANFGSTILFGNGDGTFQSPVSLGIQYAIPAAAADFNGDGIPDLVIGTVEMFLGRGDGTFMMTAQFPVDGIAALAVGDFNGDGKADVVTVDIGAALVKVWLGNGDGTFQSPMLTPSDVFAPSIAVGDFNADGKLDLAIPNVQNVSILFGNGDGTFQNGPVIPVPTTGSSLAQGDFNGDGEPDFAVINAGDSTVTVVLGQFSGLRASITHMGNFAAGQTGGSYQIVVSNPSGSASAGTVTVADVLPSGFAATSLNGSGWNCDLDTLTCNRSDALTGESSYSAIDLSVSVSVDIGISETVNSVFVSNGGVTNTASDPTPISALYISQIVNAASLTPGPVAPNTIITAFGNFPRCSRGAGVVVGGVATTVFYASATQIDLLIAGSVASQSSTTLQVSCEGLSSKSITIPVVPTAPAIFTLTQAGVGQAAIINPDGGIGATSRAGTEISIYGTGFGALAEPGSDGLSRLANTVTASVGGVAAIVTYAGGAPGFTSGLQQINVLLPTVLLPGNVSAQLVLSAGGANTQSGVTINLVP